jgi:hypothetical protein
VKDDAAAAAVMNLGGNGQVAVRRIGATGGDSVLLPQQRALSVAKLADRFEGWLPAYMAGSS